MSEAEAPLWAVLDRIGLPFRETAGDLVARFGTMPCLWSVGHRECHVPAADLLPGLSPFCFNVADGDDFAQPPGWLCASYRQARFRLTDRFRDQRAVRNHAALAGAMAMMFGAGRDVSTSNTCATEWRFGRGWLRVTAFPPHLNTRFGSNRRHDLDPGSRHEASVTLAPGYLPPVGAKALGWLSGFHVLGRPLGWSIHTSHNLPLWHRWPPELGAVPPPGFGPSADGACFVVVMAGFVKVLPREDLIGLERIFLRPAKGAGGVTLSLHHARQGMRAQSRLLMAADPLPGALMAEAERLARALDLPLSQIEDDDC